jgi:hypothetical protein
MESEAYKLGGLDAVLELGLTKEAFNKALMPLLGAGVGAVLAPEGETAQGAALGGLGMLGAQSALLGRGKSLPHVPAPAPAAVPHTPAPSTRPSLTEVGRAAFDQGKEDLKKWFNAVPPETASTVTHAPHAAAGPPNVASMPRARSVAETYATNQAANEAAARRAGMDPEAFAELKKEFERQGFYKKSSIAQFKIAVDVGGSVPIPGLGGVGVSFKDQRERLPGMSRWVPRDTIERGFDYADKGFDPEAVMDIEGDRGSVVHPLTGAALAAAGALKFAPKSGPGGALLAGLGGLGLGHLYNQQTRDTREREGLEALEGAQRERSKFPIRRHAVQTANEATPLAVSRGHGDA